MTSRSRWPRFLVAAVVWAGCFVGGWLVRASAHPLERGGSRDVAAPPPAAAWASEPASAPAEASGSARPVLYPHMVLNAEEQEILKMTPEEAIAKGDAGGASAQHIARCHDLLPDPPELCERLDIPMHHMRLADLKNLHDFLSGTLETTKFQEQHHRNMLAWQLELEDTLTYDQMMQYPGVEPGDDPFLVVTAWGIALPPGYTMGEDILMRREGEGADGNQLANPRDPFTYGKKHTHEGQP